MYLLVGEIVVLREKVDLEQALVTLLLIGLLMKSGVEMQIGGRDIWDLMPTEMMIILRIIFMDLTLTQRNLYLNDALQNFVYEENRG
ncbi:hypothetical protein DF185_22710 [Marinifilum breve]|uniref:Uncharacterized protein n=1 Tax=Marinifilum breve TaxID=2184082 RepID=A0A2V3ZR28_9BACT|nr:hypothetical protein DF185_22710 [Marinifilum breve]